MKRFIVFFFFGLILYACKTEYSPRNIQNINIKKFKKDSTSIRAIHAIDKNTVYFASSRGDIGYTTNGGASWNVKYLRYNDSIIPHFRSIASNGKDIFVLSVENPALLYKIYENKSELVYIENHKKVFYDSMQFFEDGKHGIAIGDPTENCPSIILTSDGGNTWSKIPCNQLPIFEDGEAFFAASNTNIKIINNTVWVASGGKKSRVLKSEDKGLTWSIYTTPIIQGKGPQGIYSIDFYDENNGIIVGGNYLKPNDNCATKAITYNGGKTWKLVADNQSPGYNSCVSYVPNTFGTEIFAVGRTGTHFSNDAGTSWKKVDEEKYYSIKFIDKNNAWLSGHEKIGKLVLK